MKRVWPRSPAGSPYWIKCSATGPLHQLFAGLPARRKPQLLLIAGLMPIAAVAELVTISALFPFLAVLADAKVGRGLFACRSVFFTRRYRPAQPQLCTSFLLRV